MQINKENLKLHFLSCFGIMFVQYLVLFFYKISNIKILFYVLFAIIVSCIFAGILFSLIKIIFKIFWFDPIIYLFFNFLMPFLTIDYLDKLKIYILEGAVEQNMFFVGLILVLLIWGFITKIIYLIAYYILNMIKEDKKRSNQSVPSTQQ